jgi:glycine oxidase
VKGVTLPTVVPIKGHLIGFQLEPGALGAVRRDQETYVLQRSNGFLIAGSNEQDIGFDRTVDAAICEDIHRRAAKLFPPLENATPVKRWIGFRPRSVEGDAPHIGRVSDTNVWLAYGHYRNGILLTPATAQRIADEIIVLPDA